MRVTALGRCIFGFVVWLAGRHTGECAAVAELLLAAGEQIESDMLADSARRPGSSAARARTSRDRDPPSESFRL